MEHFGQAMPVSAVPLLTVLLQRQQVYACGVSFTFKRHMTLYGTMVCFISLLLKSMALSHAPDSEHIIEITTCSKNKQSLYEVFICIKRVTSGMRMPPSPNLFNLCYLFSVLIMIR